MTTPDAIAHLLAAIAAGDRPRLLFVSHGWGGGVERHVRDLIELVRPARDVLALRGTLEGNVEVSVHGADAANDARVTVGGFSEATVEAWAAALTGLDVDRVHVHHLHGWPQDAVHRLLALLDRPLDVTLHDYALLSPRYHLEDEAGRYVGMPEDEEARRWLERGLGLLTRAERVIVPSEDVAARLTAVAPAVRPIVWPHPERPLALPALIKVALIGGISEVKGFDVLLEVEAAARAEGVPLAFRVIGHATRPLPPTITATGSYREADLPRLLALERADVYWFPAQVPETWNYALSAALATGQPIVASALGSHRERLTGYPKATLIAHDATPRAWIEALCNAADRNASAPLSAQPTGVDAALARYAERYLRTPTRSANSPQLGMLESLLGTAPAPREGTHHSLINLYRLGRFAGHGPSADVIGEQLAAIAPDETHLVGRKAFDAVDAHRKQAQAAFDATRESLFRAQQSLAESARQLEQQFMEIERLKRTTLELENRLDLASSEILRVNAELARVNAELARVNGDLMQITQSRSWRWTRPLRGVLLLARFLGRCTPKLVTEPAAAVEALRILREQGLRNAIASFDAKAPPTPTVGQADAPHQLTTTVTSSDPPAEPPLPTTVGISQPLAPDAADDARLRAEFPAACGLFPERLKSPWWIGHIPFAYELIARHRPKTIVELGTYSGSSFAAFCQALEASGVEGMCFGIDLWEGDVHMGRFDESLFNEMREFASTRHPHRSTLIRKLFDEAVHDFADGTIDLLHIDGTHTYEAVRNDFETWRPKLSDRGIVLFHDIHVTEENCGPSARKFGVRRLFDEVKAGRPHCEFLHCFGLGVLVVGTAVSDDLLQFIERCRDDDAQAYFAALGERVVSHYHALGEPPPQHAKYGEPPVNTP